MAYINEMFLLIVYFPAAVFLSFYFLYPHQFVLQTREQFDESHMDLTLICLHHGFWPCTWQRGSHNTNDNKITDWNNVTETMQSKSLWCWDADLVVCFSLNIVFKRLPQLAKWLLDTDGGPTWMGSTFLHAFGRAMELGHAPFLHNLQAA